MKNVVLYIIILFTWSGFQMWDTPRVWTHLSDHQNITVADNEEEEEVIPVSSDQTKLKKKRTRIRHAQEWGRIEPEQSFQRFFAIEFTTHSGLDMDLSTTLLSVNGKRGPPVI